VGALLHRLLQCLRYDGHSGQVTVEFRATAGMDGAAPLTYILDSPEKPMAPG
jgi:hypothetical protein